MAKSDFGTVMFLILFLSILTAISNPKAIEHKTICDAYEEGVSKTYTFGDYSFNVKVIKASKEMVEFAVNNIPLIWKGSTVSYLMVSIDVVDVYIGEAVEGKNTVKFCISA